MSYQTLPNAHEIQSILFVLEGELKRLDHAGAGIAAIHVNAAIEQLRSNLTVINDNNARTLSPSLLCFATAKADRHRQ